MGSRIPADVQRRFDDDDVAQVTRILNWLGVDPRRQEIETLRKMARHHHADERNVCREKPLQAARDVYSPDRQPWETAHLRIEVERVKGCTDATDANWLYWYVCERTTSASMAERARAKRIIQRIRDRLRLLGPSSKR